MGKPVIVRIMVPAVAVAVLVVLAGLGEGSTRAYGIPMEGLRPMTAAGLSEVVVTETQVLRPVEQTMNLAATGVLKWAQRVVRRSLRAAGDAFSRSADVFWSVLVFLGIALLAPLMDGALLRMWRQHGVGGVRMVIALGAAVFIRLLVDGRAPLVGKGMLIIALAYGLLRHDLLPDWSIPLGFLDDVLIIVLAARGFMWLCPEQLVQEHAIRATLTRQQSLRRKRRVWL